MSHTSVYRFIVNLFPCRKELRVDECFAIKRYQRFSSRLQSLDDESKQPIHHRALFRLQPTTAQASTATVLGKDVLNETPIS